jgi:SNF2 family DNA or RNA helicase
LESGAEGEELLTEEESALVIHRLHNVLRPFLLRRKKSEVETGLPEKTDFVIFCDMSAWQRLYYQQVVAKKNIHSKSLQNMAMQLRKICNHPVRLLATARHLCVRFPRRSLPPGLHDRRRYLRRKIRDHMHGSCQMQTIDSKQLFDLRAGGTLCALCAAADVIERLSTRKMGVRCRYLTACGRVGETQYLFVDEDAHEETAQERLRASGKYLMLSRILEKLHRTGHRVLLFSQMVRALEIVQDMLEDAGYKFLRLDGKTKVGQSK